MRHVILTKLVPNSHCLEENEQVVDEPASSVNASTSGDAKHHMCAIFPWMAKICLFFSTLLDKKHKSS